MLTHMPHMHMLRPPRRTRTVRPVCSVVYQDVSTGTSHSQLTDATTLDEIIKENGLEIHLFAEYWCVCASVCSP
jgi:hypothetical protein